MLAGVSVEDATPRVGERLTFYGPARGAVDPLRLSVVALRHDDHLALVVAVDVLGLGRPLTEAIRADLRRAVGAEAPSVLVTYSHTHYGAQTLKDMCRRVGPYDCGYVRRLRSSVVDAAHRAVARMEPVTLRVGTGHVAIGMNRRRMVEGRAQFAPNPLGPLDDALAVVVLERVGSGAPLAVLFAHACHPTARPGGDGRASADWPGAARTAIESAVPGTVAVFLQGCCGDIRPARRDVPSEEAFRGIDDAAMQAMGRAVGEQVLSVMQRPGDALEPRVRGNEITVDLPFGPMPGAAELDAARRSDNDDDRHWAEVMGSEPERLRPTVPLHVQRLDLATDFAIVAIAGEPVQEYAAAIRGLGRGLLPIGYSNGLVSYIPTDHMIAEGGYEVDRVPRVFLHPAPFAVGIEDAVMGGVRRLLSA